MSWQSQSSAVYEVDEADAFNTNSDGTTQWNTLYTDYPSQGTNTFWLDTGNYRLTPAIVHPKYSPMRFYRVVNVGFDTTPDEPTVAIESLTNGSVLTGGIIITVQGVTDQVDIKTKLYVDGQEMSPALLTTNAVNGTTNTVQETYLLNTCEWLNGAHILFATAECQSGFSGPMNQPAVGIGHGVSPFITTTFSNLVTGISFSQPFFDPASGQIQQVSAIFSANVDWTLQIQDINTNTVLTVTNYGGSMQYNWNGTGNGGTNLPTGIYHYVISAVTNGLAYPTGGGPGGGGSGDGLPSPSFASSLYSSAVSDTIEVDYPPLPPGMTNDGPTNATITVPRGLNAASGLTSFGSRSGGASPDGLSDNILAQIGPPAPVQPPTAPIRGIAGSFGIAYDTYSANGTNGINVNAPDNGLGIGQHIHMEGDNASMYNSGPLLDYVPEANNFVSSMEDGGWISSFVERDDQFSIGNLRGGGTIFNNVNFGVLMTHGDYGTSLDYTANQCKQMYFPITSGTSSQYIRMSEMNFGGSGSNGLEWMALVSCFSLYQNNWSSMQNAGITPINGNLHLLIGANTFIYTSPNLMGLWPAYMLTGKATIGTNGQVTFSGPMTIQAAWYQAGTDAYAGSKQNYGQAMEFAVAGDTACSGDYLKTNSTPTGTKYYDHHVVYTP